MTRLILTIFAIICVTHSFSQKSLTVGQRITGDFNGDGKVDTAFVRQITNAKANTKGWTLFFSDKTILSMRLGCCDVYLINDKATEISIFQTPDNGCAYMWTTYSYKSGRWTKLIPTFLVSAYCTEEIKILLKEDEKRSVMRSSKD